MKDTRIPASEHPDYPLESQRLRDSHAAIVREYAVTRDGPCEGGNRWTTKQVEEMRDKRLDVLERLEDEPYFGRIDICSEESGTETFYVSRGDVKVDAGAVRIIDWRTKVGGLFASGGAKSQRVTLPSGVETRVDLLLKRQLETERATLHRIIDLVDNRPAGDPLAGNAEEAYVAEKIGERRRFRLEDIVRTIQSEQDDLLRCAWDQSLVINGVAGSGKTSVAYYRLAYLLYPGTESGITAPTSLILGPNPLFLSYTHQLLPDLGVHSVRQTTFTDLVLGQVYAERGNLRDRHVRFRRLGGSHEFTVRDGAGQVLESRTASPEQRAVAADASIARGAVEVGDIMRDYADSLSATARAGIPTTTDAVPSCEPAIQQVLARQKEPLPPNERESLLAACRLALAPDRVVDALRYFATSPIGSARLKAFEFLSYVDDSGRRRHDDPILGVLRSHGVRDEVRRARLVERIEGAIDDYLASIVPPVDAPALYYRLAAEADLVTPLKSRSRVKALKAITGRRSAGRDTVYADDIPAIAALHFALFGAWLTDYSVYENLDRSHPPAQPLPQSLKHVVIDEGQDLAPLSYALLRSLLAPSGSMTILGDMSQGVTAYLGVSSWGQVTDALGGGVRIEEMLRSYRSTSEIVHFCNQILRVRGGYAAPIAQPIERHGEKPLTVIRRDRPSAMVALQERVAALAADDYTTIALVCRDGAHRRRTMKTLEGVTLALAVHELREDSDAFDGGVSVITARDAKGLEFEAAIVLDADAAHYAPQNEYDRKALYVACTRALHSLTIIAIDEATPLLKHAKGLGITG